MTGAFDTLIYTDCRPGQGLLGTAGLQFQACSSEAARAAMGLVRRSLLYEAPVKWMQERRPPAEYPPSFAHAWDGYYATAAGVYLGREVSGHREGNQLTHSIVTEDPASYGGVRPAQLFRAPFWTVTPTPTTRCPPLVDGWQHGPLDAETVQRFVTGSAGGVAMLIALLSALHRASDRRVLFLSRDADAVLRWLTAATLLIPRDRAVRIGFKVFTTNPAYAPQHVLAVHPDWSTNTATVANDLGYAVFDLTTYTWSRIEPTAMADLWARLFCTEDPYDVTDAVEVATATGLPDLPAAAVSRAAVLGHQLTGERATAAAWLRHGPRQIVGLYGDRLAASVLETPEELPRNALVDLDEAVRGGRLPDRARTLRPALVRLEVDRAVRYLDVLDEVSLPPHRDPAGEAETAIVMDALRTAAPKRFEALLRVATRFGITLDYAELTEAVERFVQDWRAHPAHGWQCTHWPDGRYLEDLLRARLDEEAVRDLRLADEIGDAWWRHLEPKPPPPSTTLDEVLLAAAVAYEEPGRRQEIVKSWLDDALRTGSRGAELARCVSLLWRRTAPTTDEFVLLLRRLPPGTALPSFVFRELIDAVKLNAARPAESQVYPQLVQRGLLLRTPETNLHELIQSLPKLRGPDGIAAQLAAIEDTLIVQEKPRLVAAMLDSAHPAVIRAVLLAKPSLTHEYAPELLATFLRRGEPTHAAATFYVAYAQDLPQVALGALTIDLREHLRRRLEVWVKRASQRKLDQAEVSVSELGEEWRERWRRLVSEQSVRANWTGWRRRLGR